MSAVDETSPAHKENPAEANTPRAGKQAYRAFSVSADEQRHLEIRLKFPDPAECPSNAMLRNIRADWRIGMGLTLEYGDPRCLTMMVIIDGGNLTELCQALKQWKVEWIAEFSPREHAEPENSSAPFIRSITINTKPSEVPPPAGQRH